MSEPIDEMAAHSERARAYRRSRTAERFIERFVEAWAKFPAETRASVAEAAAHAVERLMKSERAARVDLTLTTVGRSSEHQKRASALYTVGQLLAGLAEAADCEEDLRGDEPKPEPLASGIWTRQVPGPNGWRPVDAIMVCDGCGKRVTLRWERNGAEIECVYRSPGAHHCEAEDAIEGRNLCDDCHGKASAAVEREVGATGRKVPT